MPDIGLLREYDRAAREISATPFPASRTPACSPNSTATWSATSAS